MRRIISVAFLGLVLAATAAAQAGKPVNSKCPVKTDIPAKADITSAYKGLVIGFCCQDCKGKFSGNPDVYAEKSPEIKAALAKSGGAAKSAGPANMTGPCDCKKIVKGYYCEKDKRELGPDDVRNGLCKRCEMKPTTIEYCLKLVPKPFDAKKKVQDPPGEDKARIHYECETCMAKGDAEDSFKHKPDCKATSFAALKKICDKSGKYPHATKDN
jgi:YHS domain-containing protein